MTKYVQLIDQDGTILGDGGFEHLPRQGETLIVKHYHTDYADTYRVEAVEHEVQATPLAGNPTALLDQGTIVRVSWVSRASS